MSLNVGDAAELTRIVTDADIRRFADLIDDHNPIHLDDEFARASRFGKRIAHGMFGAALISGLLATRLPGPGAIYISQSLQFRNPIFLGDTVTVRAEITRVRSGKNVFTIATSVSTQDGTRAIDGEAVVMLPTPA